MDFTDMDILTFGSGFRKGETFQNGCTKAERNYIDFIVSGQSLRLILGLHDTDLIGTFGWIKNKAYENKKIDEFLGLGKPELETGRTPFYVCPECGDIGCGAITAMIEITDDYVIWRDFGYENDYSEPVFDDYKEIGPFKFDKRDYNKIFEILKKK